ncbi:MAG TPA: glycosyltransferase family 1 protein [Methylomirabilota bacterium]|nr:glycosyltransferase family 1 protein [Methylomirabilota bacterium]
MTFPNRNQAGSGAYARSLLAAVAARDDVDATPLSGPRVSGITGTLRWMISGAQDAVRASHASLLHCPAFVAPWNVRAPLVISILDVTTRKFPQDYPAEWRLYEGRLLPRQARKAALIVAISENTRRDVIAEYRLDPERVLTIHPGVDGQFASAAPPQATDQRPTLLFPGAPIARKNLDVVLRALAAAPRDSAAGRATLQISGATASGFPEHARRIAELGLTSRVRWLGQVPRHDLPGVMAAATAVVYPSLYEGFGFPPLEAMAAGTPVVASNAACLPEVLGDAAELVDPNDDAALTRSLEVVLTRPDLRARLIAAGRQRAAMFTWERCAEETVAAYRRVLQEAAA